MKAAFLLNEDNYKKIYSPDTIKKIDECVQIIGRFDQEDLESIDLSDVKFIFSGWSGIPINEKLLERMPNLKVIFYGSGSIKKVQTDAMWDRNVRITSASVVNAIPVAQYTLSLIQLSLKNFFRLTTKVKKNKQRNIDVFKEVPGFYNKNIGIISYSKIGQKLIDYLKNLGHNNIYIYDPFLSDEKANNQGLIKASLEEVFKKCDVVSLHAPLIPETENMITKKHFELMKDGATFINTARGKIINHDELIEVFSKRDDLFAILDVTDPEPMNEYSKIFEMDNVIISPHIAGSLGDEIFSMGELMYEELVSYLDNENLQYEISKEDFLRMA